MKESSKIKLFACFVACIAMRVLVADTENVDGITWNYTLSGDSVSIGGGTSSSTAVPTSTSGAITIPSTLGGKSVTSIGEFAFLRCSGLTSVTIPDSVTSIESYAFSLCSGLTSVTIPNSVTNIGEFAFRGCSGLTSVTVPDSVTSIESYVFYECSGLENVTIPNSVTSIGQCALYGCRGLKGVTIPNSVTNIEWSAFAGCRGLASVTIPGSVTSIGGAAFYHCTNLTSVTILEGVRNIGYDAFEGCAGLESVTIPDSVTSIGKEAFSGCNACLYDTISGVKLVDGWVVGHEDTISGELELPEVRGIGSYVFSNCTNLTSVTIPQYVCSSKISTVFPSAYQTIQSVVISDGVASIGSYAFSGCSGLANVTIPSSVTNIGSYAFSGCSGLTSVTVPQYICSSRMSTVFPSAYQAIQSVVISDGVTSIGAYAFSGCSGLTSMTIPNSVTNIGEFAFRGCSGLTSVTIPDNVKGIGYGAFSDCDGITSVTISQRECSFKMSEVFPSVYESIQFVFISDSVMSIGRNMFLGCSGLTSVTIPQSVCSSRMSTVFPSAYWTIQSVVISDGVTSIGDFAFYGCGGLASVTIPDSVTNIGYVAFGYCSSLASMTIPDSATSIGAYAFEECRGLTNVTIGSGVTSIGDYAFSISGLTSVIIPDSVRSIGYRAFEYCRGLESVTMGNGVTNIAFELLLGCSGLKSISVGDGNVAYSSVDGLLLTKDGKTLVHGVNGDVTIPDGVASVASGAFGSYSGLTSVIIPDSVTNIGEYAFFDCYKLARVMIPDGVMSIGEGAFWRSGLTSVIIPDSVRSVGDGAFEFLVEKAELPMYFKSHASACKGAFPTGCKIIYREPRWTVVLDAKGGEFADGVINRMSVFNSKAVGALPAASRNRYSFLGWFTAASGGTQVSEKTKVTADATYYAHWQYVGDADVNTIIFEMDPSYVTARDGSFSLDLSEVVGSLSTPKLTVKGLPTGLKYDAKTLAISGKATKPGVYTVTVSATNATVKQPVVKTFELTVDFPTLKLETAAWKDESAGGKVAGGGRYPAGAKVTLKATPDKKCVFMGWYDGDSLVSQSASYAYFMADEDVTLTAKFITAAEDASEIVLAIDGATVSKDEAHAAYQGVMETNVMCGVACRWSVASSALSATTVKVAGLPSGLKFTDKGVLKKGSKTEYDVPPNTIYGAPSAASKVAKTGAVTPSDVKIKVTTSGKSTATYLLRIVVAPLPTWSVGDFVGVADNGVESGTATMSVAAAGKISGKVSLFGTNWTFKADSYGSVECDADGTNFLLNATATAGKATKPMLIRVAAVDAGSVLVNARAEGRAEDGEMSFTLWRGMWKDKATAGVAKAELAKWQGLYTLSIDDGGYLSLTVGKDGSVKAAGKLADGTSVSAASPLMYDEGNGMFTYICTMPSAYKGGVFALGVGFDSNGDTVVLYDCLGVSRWISYAPQATGAYGEGFVRDVSFVGSYYDKLASLSDYYESLRVTVPAPTLFFTYKMTYLDENERKKTDFEISQADAFDLSWQDGFTVDVTSKGFSIAKATKPTQDRETKEWLYEGVNDGALTLSFTQATGIFKGSATFWFDYVSAYDDTKETNQETMVHMSKKASFEGIWVQNPGSLRGFYSWDAIGMYEDLNTGKVKTYTYKEPYMVELAP